jgi:hypothetical protein
MSSELGLVFILDSGTTVSTEEIQKIIEVELGKVKISQDDILDYLQTKFDGEQFEIKDIETDENGNKKYYIKLKKPFYYTSVENPTTNVNPPDKGVLWLNLKTGEIFVCIDNTENKNIWIGSKDNIIIPSTVNTFDIFKDNSAVALYRLDGNPYDDGGLYNARWYGSELYDIGKFNLSAKLTGNSYLYSNACNGLDETVSISMWFKAFYQYGMLFNLGAYTVEMKLYNNYLLVAFGDRWYWINTGKKVTLNIWYHLVVSYNKTTGQCNIWLNKEKIYSGSRTSTRKWGTFCLGYRLDGAYDIKFHGLIDQVRLFNREIKDDTEINLLYTEGQSI